MWAGSTMKYKEDLKVNDRYRTEATQSVAK